MVARRAPSAAALIAIFVLPSALLVTLVAIIGSAVHIPAPTRLDDDDRREVMGRLRGAFDADAAGKSTGRLLEQAAAEPLIVGVWLDGIELIRVVGRGERLADAVATAGAKLQASLPVELRNPASIARARIKVDRIAGSGALWRSLGGLSHFALHPGIDGVAARAPDGRELFLVPADLIGKQVLTAAKPLKFIPDLKVGVDLRTIEMIAATRFGVAPSQWRQLDVSWRRFRTDAFVEPPEGERDRPPIPLFRNLPPRPALSSQALREAAIAGGRYLVEHLADSGRYIYERDLASGEGTNPKVARPYSLPRHAGTTYFLAQLYRITGEAFLAEPIERAFAHLVELVEQGGCEGKLASGAPFSCVVDLGAVVTSLGSTALTVVALAEYRRATGKSTYDELAIALTEWILDMQRADGSFAHIYNVEKREKDEKTQMLYFSGEAALALARMYEVYRDPRYLDATERALDDLVAWYDFFAGTFFYGEEHWTCIASEAIWPHLKHDRYRAFCDGYGAFLRLIQPDASDFPGSPDLAGTYAFTPFIVPNNTPAGSRTEAMVSAYRLGANHGKPNPAIRQQILAAVHFALGQQVTADGEYWIPAKATAVGGVPASPIEQSVRIDYVQHICSAMIRTAVLLEESAAAAAPGQ